MAATTGDEYNPIGRYEKVADINCYITGSESSNCAIVDIFDAFGFRPPTLRGADLLATSVPCLVIMPDLFKGGPPADPSWFPTDTDEKAAALKEFQPKAYNSTLVPTILQVAADAKLKWPAVQAWGCFGLGWGGKLVAQASSAGTPFKASGQAFPSQPAREDAEKLAIPHIALASKKEAEPIKQYAQVFSGDGRVGEVEVYGTMSHGWMGTMADLTKTENVKEFERGYKQAARFFAEHL